MHGLRNNCICNFAENLDEAKETEDYKKQLGYDELYTGHIPTTPFQRVLLALGSAAMCLYNPARDGEWCLQTRSTL